jgi:hypothetical protein
MQNEPEIFSVEGVWGEPAAGICNMLTLDVYNFTVILLIVGGGEHYTSQTERTALSLRRELSRRKFQQSQQCCQIWMDQRSFGRYYKIEEGGGGVEVNG